MTQEEWEMLAEVVVQIRDAMQGLAKRIGELTETSDRLAKAIEQAAEEIRDA